MRSRLFILLFLLALWMTAAARTPASDHGMRRSREPQAQSQQRQGMQQRQHQQQQQHDRERQQDRERQRTRLHDCQQACIRAQEESRQLQRYADRENFEPATAQRLGRQLRERLEVMDREHSRLRERLTTQEQERHRERLQAMDQRQQRWEENLRAIEQELKAAEPRPEELRRRARTIEKEVKNYRKELDRLASALEP